MDAAAAGCDVCRISLRALCRHAFAARFAAGFAVGFQRIAAGARSRACGITRRARSRNASSASARIRRRGVAVRRIAADGSAGFRSAFAARLTRGISVGAERVAGVARSRACGVTTRARRDRARAACQTRGIAVGAEAVAAAARSRACGITRRARGDGAVDALTVGAGNARAACRISRSARGHVPHFAAGFFGAAVVHAFFRAAAVAVGRTPARNRRTGVARAVGTRNAC